MRTSAAARKTAHNWSVKDASQCSSSLVCQRAARAVRNRWLPQLYPRLLSAFQLPGDTHATYHAPSDHNFDSPLAWITSLSVSGLYHALLLLTTTTVQRAGTLGSARAPHYPVILSTKINPLTTPFIPIAAKKVNKMI